MRVVIIILWISIMSACCKAPTVPEYCNYQNPIEELSILKNEIDTAERENETIRIKYYKFKNKEYFEVFYKYNIVFYDCNGDILCKDKQECEDFYKSFSRSSFIEWRILYPK